MPRLAPPRDASLRRVVAERRVEAARVGAARIEAQRGRYGAQLIDSCARREPRLGDDKERERDADEETHALRRDERGANERRHRRERRDVEEAGARPHRADARGVRADAAQRRCEGREPQRNEAVKRARRNGSLTVASPQQRVGVRSSLQRIPLPIASLRRARDSRRRSNERTRRERRRNRRGVGAGDGGRNRLQRIRRRRGGLACQRQPRVERVAIQPPIVEDDASPPRQRSGPP